MRIRVKKYPKICLDGPMQKAQGPINAIRIINYTPFSKRDPLLIAQNRFLDENISYLQTTI